MQISFKNIREQFMRMPIVLHVLLIVGVLCLLSAITLQSLKGYTLHNQAIVVPDVKGLQLEEAATFFDNNDLRYTVIDSVYTKDVPPGAIYEMVPGAGSKVKEGRIIFVTLNARTVQTAPVPDITDLSFRQAYALLQSKGFTSIDILYVPGRYRDLALGVELRGNPLKPGERIPVAAQLVLKVSDGGSAPDAASGDSIDTPPRPRTEEATTSSENEKWF
ncbi:PASTA domain-containing protein [Tannerella sp.]|uniref:PASTA domain-containing protein n=1 Tax=Tannerella sp. TaxID=2382127 RepID=UPI0026DCAAF4|nr:PASTA domain-containing protein [Tannerella sp.]MDO4702489.1 PASTA domain-containing protein [Tannerella sp.]